MKSSNHFQSRTSKLVTSALFCALIILGTYIRLPFPIPITLQLVFTNVSALLLGAKWGAVPSLLYLACRLIGIPVFSYGGFSFDGGVAGVLSVSFGFVVGFAAGAFLASLINDRAKFKHKDVVASAVNLLCVYLFGTVHYAILCNFYLLEQTTLSELIYVCIIPFILPDIIKLWASIILYRKLKTVRTK